VRGFLTSHAVSVRLEEFRKMDSNSLHPGDILAVLDLISGIRMKPQEVKAALKQTLEDRKLSRGEKRAMGSLIEVTDPTAQTLANYRSMAFDLAREEMTDGHSKEVIEWLEDVNKLFLPSSGGDEKQVAEAYFSPGEDCLNKLTGLLRSARQTVDVCVFTITDNRITDALVDAHKRGVQLRIITDNDKSEDLGSDVERLENMGLPLRMDKTRHHMHHKFAIFDGGILLSGSYNWTRSATMNNQENILLTNENRLISPFSDTFEKLWYQFA